jgi:hypothetical protein
MPARRNCPSIASPHGRGAGQADSPGYNSGVVLWHLGNLRQRLLQANSTSIWLDAVPFFRKTALVCADQDVSFVQIFELHDGPSLISERPIATGIHLVWCDQQARSKDAPVPVQPRV